MPQNFKCLLQEVVKLTIRQLTETVGTIDYTKGSFTLERIAFIFSLFIFSFA